LAAGVLLISLPAFDALSTSLQVARAARGCLRNYAKRISCSFLY